MAVRKAWFSDEQLKSPKKWILDYVRRYPPRYIRKIEMQQRFLRNIESMADLFRKHPMPALSVADFMEVQPMSLPTAQVFYMDFRYGDDLPNGRGN